MNISCILYKTLWNFNDAITRHDCHDYVDKIWNEFENVHTIFTNTNNYKIFTENICILNIYN